MNAVRVYDLPTRVFHWSFAGLFVAAYAIANLVDDESARFAWHMLAGLMLGLAVLLRLVWGGDRHAPCALGRPAPGPTPAGGLPEGRDRRRRAPLGRP